MSFRSRSSPQKFVSPSKVKSLLNYENVYNSDNVLSIPSLNTVTDIKENMSSLFNLSIDDCVKISEDKSIFKIVLHLLDIRTDDKDSIRKINKFIKYIANIPDAKSKNPNELFELINKKKNRSVRFSDLPLDIKNIIGNEYDKIVYPYKLIEWIEEDKLDWKYLSRNESPGAIQYLQKNPHLINWEELSRNKSTDAINFLSQHNENIKWVALESNDNPRVKALFDKYKISIGEDQLYLKHNVVDLIKDKDIKNDITIQMMRKLSMNKNDDVVKYVIKYMSKYIQWVFFSENENPIALEYMKTNTDKIYWNKLASNDNPEAIKIFKDNPEKITLPIWKIFSGREESFDILNLGSEENKQYISWDQLSFNPHPRALALLEENPDKINWANLSHNTNPRALALLEENPDKINWANLSSNPSIFEKR